MYKSVNTHSYINHSNGNALIVTNTKDLSFFSTIGYLSQQLLKNIVRALHSASVHVYLLLVGIIKFLELWKLCN